MKHLVAALGLLGALSASTSALAGTVAFRCVAGAGYTCYFSSPESAGPVRSWVMRPRDNARIADFKVGDQYYVASSPVYGNAQVCGRVLSQGGWCYLKAVQPGVNT